MPPLLRQRPAGAYSCAIKLQGRVHSPARQGSRLAGTSSIPCSYPTIAGPGSLHPTLGAATDWSESETARGSWTHSASETCQRTRAAKPKCESRQGRPGSSRSARYRPPSVAASQIPDTRRRVAWCAWWSRIRPAAATISLTCISRRCRSHWLRAPLSRAQGIPTAALGRHRDTKGGDTHRCTAAVVAGRGQAVRIK